MSIPSSLLIAAVAVSLLGSSAAPASTEAATAPELTVQVLGVNGTGCPVNSSSKVTVDVGAAGAVTLKYPDFTVSGGDYATCVVTLGVAAPEGWTYAVPTVENLAWVELGADGAARIQTNAWFTGYPWTLTDDNKTYGPLDNYWETTSPAEETMWAPCGDAVNLSIAETLRVSGAPANTATLIATTIARPAWRRC